MLRFLRKTRFVFAGVILISFAVFLLSRDYGWRNVDPSYGVTFSARQAESLGLDWRAAYQAILEDLGVKKIRLSAYWDEVEAVNNRYVWDDLDWQVSEARKSGAEIILAVGGRLPRWPECHVPEWAKNSPQEKYASELLAYIKETVSRYKDNGNIRAWQIENEPFLINFGECPKLDKGLLDREIALVKSLDSRPIIITDSGELSAWVPAAKRADIFGTTMYRDTYSKLLKSYVHYPIEPGFFRFKKNIANFFARPDKWLVIELQAEPWGPVPFQNMGRQERDLTMSPEKFRDMIRFSRDTGFSEFYLWGAEWWYWEKVKNNETFFWEEAKSLF